MYLVHVYWDCSVFMLLCNGHTSREGHIGVARLLLGAGADVETPDNYGQSPFFMACWKGMLVCFEFCYVVSMHIHVHVHVCACVYAHVCVCMCVYVCMYVCMYVSMYVNVCMYVCTYIVCLVCFCV